MPKFALLCTVSVMVLAMGIAAPARAQTDPATPAPTADTVVATVNGTDITLGHMIATRDGLPDQYDTLEPSVLYKGILDQLIQQTALEQSAAADVTKRNLLTLDNQRRGYLSGIVLQKVVETAVTDATIQAAYDMRIKDLAPATEYRASHILVDSLDKAKDLKAQIDGGADFATLATANSTDGSAAEGGDLGWFGVGMMVKPFEDAVLALQPGAVSDPVETQFGWHLVKLVETRAATAPTLDDLREELAAEIETKALQDHIAAVTAAATVTRPGDTFDPAILSDTTLLAD